MNLKKPFLIAGFLTCLFSLLLQLGTAGLLQQKVDSLAALTGSVSSQTLEAFPEMKAVDELRSKDPASANQFMRSAADEKPPGLAIGYLAVMETLILLSLGLMLLSMVIGNRAQGLVQGGVTAFFSLISLVVAFVLLEAAIAKLTLMVSLFLAAPFGTLAYLGAFGSFKVGAASATLGLLLLLKFGLAGLLFLAHPRFFQNKGLIFLGFCIALAIVVTAFLHGMVPGILASIADAVAAIIIAMIAILFSVFYFITSLPGIYRAMKSLRPA